MTRNKKGFTLVELLIYIAIFVIVIGLLTSILVIIFRIQNKESSSTEVTSQLNFVMQKIQGLMRESSAIIVNDTNDNDASRDDGVGSPQRRLILRMEEKNRDPICIYLSQTDNKIKMAQGGVFGGESTCTTDSTKISDLTNDKVKITYGATPSDSGLNFTKITQYPGHDTVNIAMTMEYNTTNPQKTFIRKLASAIGRVSAATFDDDVVPGSSNKDLGGSGSPWQDIFLSGVINVGTSNGGPPAGSTYVKGAIYYDDTGGFLGYNGTTWNPIGAGFWTANASNEIYNNNTTGVNVGINTNDPKVRLDVIGNSTGGTTLRLGPASAANLNAQYTDKDSSYLVLDRDPAKVSGKYIHDASVVFRTNGNARGEIGIFGGYSGVTEDALILKTARNSFGSENFFDSLILKQNSDVIISGDEFTDGGGMLKGGKGKLGINTNSPTDIIHAASSTLLVGTRLSVKIENTNTGANSRSSGVSLVGTGINWYMGTDYGMNGGDNFFIQGGSAGTNPRLFIDSTGRIGIGTDVPTTRLQVAGGGVYLSTIGTGIILRSAGGCVLVSANAGATGVTAVNYPCP